jgi:hypothetical protein
MKMPKRKQIRKVDRKDARKSGKNLDKSITKTLVSDTDNNSSSSNTDAVLKLSSYDGMTPKNCLPLYLYVTVITLKSLKSMILFW